MVPWQALFIQSVLRFDDNYLCKSLILYVSLNSEHRYLNTIASDRHGTHQEGGKKLYCTVYT